MGYHISGICPLILAAALATAGPVAPINIPEGPELPSVKIYWMSFSGNGCPQGTVSAALSADASDLTFAFDGFRVETGTPGIPISARSKNCQLHIVLEKPDGWQYSVTRSVWQGFAQLDASVTATMSSTYYFSDAGDSPVATKLLLAGPAWASGNFFTIRQEVSNDSVIWSPCNGQGILNINNRVSLTSSTVQGYGFVGLEDIANILQTGIIWRTC